MDSVKLAPKSCSPSTTWVLLSATVLTALLYLVPFLHPLSYPFLLLSTLVHEMAHGFAAILVGGHFMSFMLWADGSGAAQINGNFGPLSRSFVAAAGLVGPAIAASLFFIGLKSLRRSRIILAAFGIMLILAILLVVRNLFGIAFVAATSALCLFFSLGAAKAYAQSLAAFFGVQLSLSVFSRSDYLFTDTAFTSAGPLPSDVAQIAEALWLPYWFFGALCGLFSLAVLSYGLRKILP